MRQGGKPIRKLIYFLTKWKTGHHHGQRVNIKKDLRKNGKFLPEELVGEVDGGVDDAGAVGPDGVSDVPDADSVEVLAVAGLLYENLNNNLVTRRWRDL